MSTTSTLFLTDIIDNQSKESKSAQALVKESDWRFVQLGNYTSASPLVVNNNTTSKVMYQASDISFTTGKDLIINYDYVAQKWLPDTLNDLFMIEIRFKCKSSAQNSHLDLMLEAPTFLYNPLNAQTQSFVRAANNEQFMSANFYIYIGQDIIDKGVEMKISASGGNISIYDFSYLMVRIASGV